MKRKTNEYLNFVRDVLKPEPIEPVNKLGLHLLTSFFDNEVLDIEFEEKAVPGQPEKDQSKGGGGGGPDDDKPGDDKKGGSIKDTLNKIGDLADYLHGQGPETETAKAVDQTVEEAKNEIPELNEAAVGRIATLWLWLTAAMGTSEALPEEEIEEIKPKVKKTKMDKMKQKLPSLPTPAVPSTSKPTRSYWQQLKDKPGDIKKEWSEGYQQVKSLGSYFPTFGSAPSAPSELEKESIRGNTLAIANRLMQQEGYNPDKVLRMYKEEQPQDETLENYIPWLQQKAREEFEKMTSEEKADRLMKKIEPKTEEQVIQKFKLLSGSNREKFMKEQLGITPDNLSKEQLEFIGKLTVEERAKYFAKIYLEEQRKKSLRFKLRKGVNVVKGFALDKARAGKDFLVDKAKKGLSTIKETSEILRYGLDQEIEKDKYGEEGDFGSVGVLSPSPQVPIPPQVPILTQAFFPQNPQQEPSLYPNLNETSILPQAPITQNPQQEPSLYPNLNETPILPQAPIIPQAPIPPQVPIPPQTPIKPEEPNPMLKKELTQEELDASWKAMKTPEKQRNSEQLQVIASLTPDTIELIRRFLERGPKPQLAEVNEASKKLFEDDETVSLSLDEKTFMQKPSQLLAQFEREHKNASQTEKAKVSEKYANAIRAIYSSVNPPEKFKEMYNKVNFPPQNGKADQIKRLLKKL